MSPSCHFNVSSGRRGSPRRTDDRFAGEGYTIGRSRCGADAPDRHGAGDEVRRRPGTAAPAASRRSASVALLQVGVDRARRRVRQREQHVARRRARVDAGLARMHGQAVGDAREDRGRDAQHARDLAHGLERRVRRLLLQAGATGNRRSSAPLGRRKLVGIAPVDGSRRRCAPRCPGPRRRRCSSESAQQRLRRGVDVDARGLVDGARPVSVDVAVLPRVRDARPASTPPACAAATARTPVRSIAPSAAARACASDSALRADSASLRIENAKPLAITVSMIVSQSTMISAMPRRSTQKCAARVAEARAQLRALAGIVLNVCIASSLRRTALADGVPGAATRFRRRARRDDERRPRLALARHDFDLDQQRQAAACRPSVSRQVGAPGRAPRRGRGRSTRT